jgi:hypothetical protein
MLNPTIAAIEAELAAGPRGVWLSLDHEGRRMGVASSAVREALARRHDVERRGHGHNEEFRLAERAPE